MCELKLQRAAELISGLGGEKTRWTEGTQALAESAAHVVGDALIAAAYVAYLGPFSAAFRCAPQLSSPGLICNSKFGRACSMLVEQCTAMQR